MEMLATHLVLLLCSASTSFLSHQAAASSSATSPPPAAVLDVNGQSLRPGQKYQVLPAFRGTGSGLVIRQRSDMCPFYVVQGDLKDEPDFDMTFTPVHEPHDEVVRTSTDLHVRNFAITICVLSDVWWLGNEEEGTGRRYVSINGTVNLPGEPKSWFRIEKYQEKDHLYKFVFCPKVCDTCTSTVCGDLGVFIEGDKGWLGFTGDKPFPVQFRVSAG